MLSPGFPITERIRTASVIILSIVEARPGHGYEISKLIETRSDGRLKFHAASLYPLLYRLEERGRLQGKWVEKPGERRRRFYTRTRRDAACSRSSATPGRRSFRRCT
jgi:DNA-binding PadR family transcriptional regulator